MADRKAVLCIVAALTELVDRFSSGIRQSQNARCFVKALPRRIIARRAENVHIRIIAHIDKQRVAARNSQAQERWFQFRVSQIICRDMPADMVYGYQRYAQCQCAGFGKIDADQYRPDQTGRIADGDRVNIIALKPRSFERTPRKLRDCFHMAA